MIVEGTFYRESRGVSGEAICAYGQAVGAVIGALRKHPLILVEPDWMPRILTGPNTLKEDRHRVTRGLVERAGWQWPEGSGHCQDALCQAAAWLASEGWL